MFDHKNAFEIGEGYGFCGLSKHSGLLTYRFFKLYSNYGSRLFKERELNDASLLSDKWKEHSVVNCFIKNENLEEDLILALSESGLKLEEQDKNVIRASKNSKTNTSERNEASFYYDHESIKWVAEKESFIIDMFSYSPPEVPEL